MFGIFNRKKTVSHQEVASNFLSVVVQVCEKQNEEWCELFKSQMKESGWVSKQKPDKINENELQWILVASVMAYECIAIKNVYDARVASRLYDAVFDELKSLGKHAGMENLEDLVFGFLTTSEKNLEDLSLLPHDSAASNIISYFGFRPKKGDSDIFPPLNLMMISAFLIDIVGGYWKWTTENYNIRT